MKKTIIIKCILTAGFIILLNGCSSKKDQLVWYLYGASFNKQNWIKEEDINKEGIIQNKYTKKFNEMLKEKGMDIEVVFKDMKVDEAEDRSFAESEKMYFEKENKAGNQIDIIPYMHSDICIMKNLDETFNGTYAKKFYEAMPDTYWKSQKIDQHTYYIPKVSLYAKQKCILVDEKMMKELKIDASSLKYDLNSLIPYMEQAKKQLDVIPFSFMDIQYQEYFKNKQYISLPLLSDYETSIYIKDDNKQYKIVNLYEEDAFQNFLKTIQKMNQKELTGAQLDTDEYNKKMEKGTFLRLGNYFPDDLRENSDRNKGYKQMPSGGYDYIRTGGDAVYYQSKKEKEAVELISLINTDQDLSNLFIYGIEGEDYQLKNGIVDPLREDLIIPDSLGSSSMIGNYIIALPSSKSCPDNTTAIMHYLKQLPDEPYLGFSPKIPDKWKDVESVYKDSNNNLPVYEKEGLLEYAKGFNEKLKAANLKSIIDDLQKQLDAYMR